MKHKYMNGCYLRRFRQEKCRTCLYSDLIQKIFTIDCSIERDRNTCEIYTGRISSTWTVNGITVQKKFISKDKTEIFDVISISSCRFSREAGVFQCKRKKNGFHYVLILWGCCDKRLNLCLNGVSWIPEKRSQFIVFSTIDKMIMIVLFLQTKCIEINI